LLDEGDATDRPVCPIGTEAASPVETAADRVPAPILRRRRALTGLLLGATLLAGVGLTAPWWIRSPQQLAADAQPPAPSVLTAPVERKVLREVVVLRGQVSAGQAFEVTPGSRSGEAGIVTGVRVHRGDRVRAGTVLLEVSGRPLFALPGAVPAYRDLKPGATGADVAQLQAALAGLGHDPHEHNGLFGTGTKQALAAFYAGLGYPVSPVSAGDDQQVAQLQRQVTTAQRQVDDARDAVDAVAADPAATAGPRAAAAKALDRAQQDLAAARTELADLIRVTGPMLPLSEYAFLPRFPATVDGLKASLGAAVAEPLITLSVGDPTVTATLSTAQRALCQPGAAVQVDGDGGLTATGTVASIGELAEPSADNAASGGVAAGYPMVVTPSPAVDPRFVGQSVRLTVAVAVSDGAALVVPVSALYAAADGQVYVTRRAPDGSQSRVEVRPGLSAQGYVAITVVGGDLGPGDQVTVGSAG
jgi:HlyD family secretion protein